MGHDDVAARSSSRGARSRGCQAGAMFGLSGAELAAAEQDAARALAAADVHLQTAERQLRAPRPAPPLAPGGAWPAARAKRLDAARCGDAKALPACNAFCAPAQRRRWACRRRARTGATCGATTRCQRLQRAPAVAATSATRQARRCHAQPARFPKQSNTRCAPACSRGPARAGEAQPARGDGGGSDDDSDDADDGGNAAADPAAADAAYRRGCDALDAGLLDEAIEALRCAARDCPAAYPVARGKIAQQLALARQRAAARAAGT